MLFGRKDIVNAEKRKETFAVIKQSNYKYRSY